MSQRKQEMIRGSTDEDRSQEVTEQERRRQRFERQRNARAEFDTITVGGARRAPQRPPPKEDESKRQRTVALDTAPVYKFQLAEVFQYDTRTLRSPSSALSEPSVRMEVDPETGATRVIPLGPTEMPPGQSTALTVRPEDQPLDDPDEMLMVTIQHALSKRPQQVTEMQLAPDDEIEISQLQTAEDVISYFSTNGATSSVKFVYLNQTPQALDFRPYDLTVVSRKQVNPSHFVLSASGVVSIKPGHPSEVMSLAEWMRETAMFNTLRRIRFFRNYLVSKSFNQWRKNIRLHLYCMIRKKLCNRFFPVEIDVCWHNNGSCEDVLRFDDNQIVEF